MENIIDRLEAVMKHFGLNNNSLTVQAGLSVGLLGQARKNRKGLHSDTIEKVLTALSAVSPAWFVLGEGEMLRQGVPEVPRVNPKKPTTVQPLTEQETEAVRSLLIAQSKSTRLQVDIDALLKEALAEEFLLKKKEQATQKGEAPRHKRKAG